MGHFNRPGGLRLVLPIIMFIMALTDGSWRWQQMKERPRDEQQGGGKRESRKMRTRGGGTEVWAPERKRGHREHIERAHRRTPATGVSNQLIIGWAWSFQGYSSPRA